MSLKQLSKANILLAWSTKSKRSKRELSSFWYEIKGYTAISTTASIAWMGIYLTNERKTYFQNVSWFQYIFKLCMICVFIASIDYYFELSFFNKTFCQCKLIPFHTEMINSLGRSVLLKGGLHKQEKNILLKLSRAPSIWCHWGCL